MGVLHAALDEERAYGEGDDATDPLQYLADHAALLFQEFQHSFFLCFWLVINVCFVEEGVR